ncbi:MAG: SufS family cysteine desulfurase [Pirellulaceae bacterium]|nr:SufS family cysteine desulfurase [Pirellulaceae bacterium]
MPDQTLDRVRDDFPILSTSMNGRPLVYLDNAASTQKPVAVIDAIANYYRCDHANIHRGVYELSQRATDQYEAARVAVAKFLGGVAPEECIFTRGTTESINLVASSWGRSQLQPGDEVLLTGSEHHSNIVPWQMVCQETGACLRVVQPDANGVIHVQDFQAALGPRTRLVAMQHTSNALGIVHDVHQFARLARQAGATILIDGAQSVAHQATDLTSLNCDFFAFSGHKLYGPTGIGVLWGRRELLQSLPPYMGGGDMIDTVTFQKTTYAALPNRFEAGTPHIAGAIGLAAAIDYIRQIGWGAIAAHEAELLSQATKRLSAIGGLQIIGQSSHKAAIVSFVVREPEIAALDIATALSLEGIAVRTGHHCCMPLMQHLGIAGTCRASFAIYNTIAEVDRLADVLEQYIAERHRAVVGRNSIGLTEKSKQPSSVADRFNRTATESAEVSEITFAGPAGDSPQAIAQTLADEFSWCDDPASKTKFLLELGQQLPDTFGQLKAITTSVPGCMSEVYLIGRPTADDPQRIEFTGDSNAQIVRGLIAVLQQLFSGQSAAAVLEFDVESFFRRIGLDQFITSQRRSGLAGMVRRIQVLAQGQLDRLRAS